MVHQIRLPSGFFLSVVITHFEPFRIYFRRKPDRDRVPAFNRLQAGLCFAGVLIKSDDDTADRIRHIIALTVHKAVDLKRAFLKGVIDELIMPVHPRQRIRRDSLRQPVLRH